MVTLLSSSAALAQSNPDREAFYGETHLHTSWSFDAFIFGDTKATPADAYDYAKGKPLKHALGFDMKISQPLDWMGVTDHSEYVGVIQQANDPTTPLSQTDLGKELVVHDKADIQRIYLLLANSMIDNKPIAALVAPELAGSVWDKNNAMADAANEPGKFTAFNSYEWTSTPNNSNLHRNVFFKDAAHLPKMPFSSFDSEAPEDLWNWMDKQRAQGIELLAISHNANLSDGLMYPTEVDFKGRPIDQAWAESRMRNEPLIEIKQIKGQSETHPLLSPNDEFANYEVMSYLLGGPEGRTPKIPGSYLREALEAGLAMQDTRGYNPYKTGVVAGSDFAQWCSAIPPGQLLRRSCVGGRRPQGADVGSYLGGWRYPPDEPGWAQRHLGRREHPRVPFRRHAAEGNLCDQRHAHQGALLRRIQLQAGRF